MSKPSFFPFVAVVGQEDVKEALLIALTNPQAGGVLVVGEKGTAKSSLVRALAQVIPNKKIIDLPLNATEDMVFGHIDLEHAVLRGEKMFSPGILGRVHEQVLYVDEINLLRQEIVASILNTADRGVNAVEREGISYQHEAKFTLIGTMNPEEGSLTSSVLDRFGMFASVSQEMDCEARIEIMRRVLAYEQNPELFCQQYQGATDELISSLQAARKLLGVITVSNAMIELTAQYCTKANVAGHRAEIFLIEAAKAIAALAGRDYLLPADMERAAFFILPHRMRKEESQPLEPEEQEENQTDDQIDEQNDDQNNDQDNDNNENQPPDNLPSDSSPDSQDENDSERDESEEQSQEQPEPNHNNDQEAISEIDTAYSNAKMAVTLPKDRQVRQSSGKRSLTRTNLHQGRYVRSCIPKGKLTDLAFDATLRAAAPYQRLREKGNCCMSIKQEDLRQKVREKRIGNTFLFVVDASGSMGARERMRAVKGAIFSMLQDAYQKRDQVGLIAFRRQTAEVLLPVTRSVDLAQKCLQQLPTGGKTPLAEGLATAFSVLTTMGKKERQMQPIIVLITDGRTNRSDDAIGDALKMAEKIQLSGCSSVVIDTETDFIKLGIARSVAQKMGATYYHLQELTGQKILHVVQNMQ